MTRAHPHRRGVACRGDGFFPDPQRFIGEWGRGAQKERIEQDASGVDWGKDQDLEYHFFCRGYYGFACHA